MNLLRQRLLKECPELHAALENSWNVANDKWLASIPTSAGSYNSGPHFRNIEGHLERLLVPWNVEGKNQDWVVKLSPLELYLLLAGVLFHDYGRVRGNENHARASQELLPIHYAWLGIPSQELAESVGRIALYHDPVEVPSKEKKSKREAQIKLTQSAPDAEGKEMRKKLEEEDKKAILASIQAAREALSDVTIEPYGRARELHIATLLALGDHLDASTQRTEPYFIRSDIDIEFKGAFRRMVVGSRFDPDTQCIKTCLRDPGKASKENSALSSFWISHTHGGKEESFSDEAQARVAEEDANQPLHEENAGGPTPQDGNNLNDLYDEMEIEPKKRRKLFSKALQGILQLERKKNRDVGWPADCRCWRRLERI